MDKAESYLYFAYQDAKGEKTRRKIAVISENDDYIRGIQPLDKGHRTFRKSQIIETYSTEDQYLQSSYPDPTPRPYTPRSSSQPKENKLEVCFTGFAAAIRKELEEKARNHGLQVRKDVTVNLDYLCTGPNAGPKKVERAFASGVVLMDEAAFHWLIETGEIPV